MTAQEQRLGVLSDERLKALLANTQQGVEGIVRAEPTDRLAPILTAICRTGYSSEEEVIHISLALLPNFERDKYRVMRACGQMLAQAGQCPLALAFVGEAWMSYLEVKSGSRTEARDKARKSPRPKNDPNRKEILLTAVMGCDMKCFSSFMIIGRNLDNTIRLGDGWEPTGEGESDLLTVVYQGFIEAGKRKMGKSK